MIVIGGTYDEFCFEPRWQETFGSGLRACRVISKLCANQKIAFHTFADSSTQTLLSQIEILLPNLKCHVTEISKTVEFQYVHPLSTPVIYPRPDILDKIKNAIEVKGENILMYGCIEGGVKVDGERVVYDPQSPVHPISFSQTGSSAKHLAVVINMTEAMKIIGEKDLNIDKIKTFFLEKEKAEVVILKMGPKGAMVLTPSEDIMVPVYKTSRVWPIGSGDVFAASFACDWFNGVDPVTAAKNASWNTAIYCNNYGSFDFIPFENLAEIQPLKISKTPQGQVYLAGPFFTFPQRWMVEEIRRALKSMHLNVFSPWHDVGQGVAADVVPADIDALDKSKIIFAVVDGLDAGTIFEVGYAVARKIPVIGYVQNETEENVKMLEGTGVVLENDLTTAIYKSLWILAEHE